MPNFAPASSFAHQFGVKALVYGPPGSGKTPLCNTAPRPVLCISEPGALSLRNSAIVACEAYTPEAIDDFYRWLFTSKEAVNFDTVCVDSISQQAEIILDQELKRNKDGRKAYGEMSRRMMEHLNGLYYSRGKHTYLICKQTTEEIGNVNQRKPYFPGKDLGVKVPHLYDEILHLDTHNIPGHGAIKAFRCAKSYDTVARDRSGRLAEFEQADLNNLFNKVMQG